MSYQLECKDNSGFEDQLTNSVKYMVREFGENSVSIVNDKGQIRSYGETHFCQPEYQD